MQKVAFLYATFPKSTETFVRRELNALWQVGCQPIPHSIWGGREEWNGIQVFLFPKHRLLTLVFWIPYWAFCRPIAFSSILKHLWNCACPNFQNFNETFLGLSFGLVEARTFKKSRYKLVHGVWATMPATAAFAIHKLTDIPFSMGAHAYDLFRKGGDWLLSLKLKNAAFVRTSSISSSQRLYSLGVAKEKVKLIRRGLDYFSERPPSDLLGGTQPLHLIAIGRLVPKKGYFYMLEIAEQLKKNLIPFRLKIVGDGILKTQIQNEIRRRGLQSQVFLLGEKSEREVRSLLLSHEVMIFTGIIDRDGDRDGIPNVIMEAMQSGCLILSSRYAGASEVFVDQVSGFSLDPKIPLEWVEVLKKFIRNPDSFEMVRRNAIREAKENFSVKKTAGLLHQSIQKVLCSKAIRN